MPPKKETPPTPQSLKAARLAKCETCPFAVNGKPVRPVLASGNPAKAIGLVVAESPGHEEVEQGEPLVGMTGQQFDLSLAEQGLPRERLFLINAIACLPIQGKTEAQMKLAVDCCRPLLLDQLKPLPADIPTFAAGKWAAYTLTGEYQGVYDVRGFLNLNFELPRPEGQKSNSKTKGRRK